MKFCVLVFPIQWIIREFHNVIRRTAFSSSSEGSRYMMFLFKTWWSKGPTKHRIVHIGRCETSLIGCIGRCVDDDDDAVTQPTVSKHWREIVLKLKGSVKEPNMFHNYETEKITRKASDVAENLQLYRVVRFFCPRSLCMTTHLMLFSERLPIYALCMTISCGRTEQLDIIAGLLLHHWIYEWFSYPKTIYVLGMMIERTEQHIIIGFGELGAVD